jgi:3-carboxymuconate cyclase
MLLQRIETHRQELHRIHLQTEKLARLNSIDGLGASPCNISNNGKEIATAEYGGGSMTRYSLNSDGSIGSMIQHIDFKGHSVDRKAQLAPHIHSVQYNPDGNVYITDLGCDNIYVLHDSCIVDTIKMEPNFGPRHIVFNKNNDIMYAIGELSGKVCVLKRENERFVPVQYLYSDITEGINGKGSADIHLSNDGKFLYTSNRLKNDGITVFAVLPDGKLEMNGYTKTGVHPRNFAITPDDNWVVVACRDSNTIEFYNRDSESGMLSAKASLTISSIKKPVFVSFF